MRNSWLFLSHCIAIKAVSRECWYSTSNYKRLLSDNNRGVFYEADNSTTFILGLTDFKISISLIVVIKISDYYIRQDIMSWNNRGHVVILPYGISHVYLFLCLLLFFGKTFESIVVEFSNNTFWKAFELWTFTIKQKERVSRFKSTAT